MKLSSKGRYAVMALADMAKSLDHKPIPLKDISLRQGISIFYLEQLFLKLKKNNIVNSSRGVTGGYKLSKSPDLIKLSNIFSAVNEEVKSIKCNKKSKKGCNGKSVKCITHNLWDELEIHINTFFENKTLKDVLDIENKFRSIN
jgi:Rrf2 family iron-sulfur cluster assembly transcriptional regulator